MNRYNKDPVLFLHDMMASVDSAERPAVLAKQLYQFLARHNSIIRHNLAVQSVPTYAILVSAQPERSALTITRKRRILVTAVSIAIRSRLLEEA